MSWARRYFTFLQKHSLAFHGLLIVLTIIAAICTSRLSLKTNFSELLPEKLPSVQNIKLASQRVGGTGVLLIGIKSPNFAANKKFTEDLAVKLKTLEGTKLRYFEYRFDEVKTYLSKFALHYLNNEQLLKLRDGLKTEIEAKKDNAISGFLGLNDENETATKEENKSATQEWLKDVDPNFQKFMGYREAYLSTDDGQTMVMTLRPFSSSLSVNDSKKLIETIKGFIAELKPETYNPKLHVGFGGNIQSAVEEFQTVKSDIFDTAVLLIALILGVLFLFFWSIRIVALLTLHIIIPVIWTFALTWLHIGYLNTQTAFLGSLVVGTGINYGVIFVSRYLERRRLGEAVFEAIVYSIEHTAVATLIASSTTAVAFVSLLIADNKGFSQFGFIGSIGVILCWLAAYSLFPLWLFNLEKGFPSKLKTNPLARYFQSAIYRFGNALTRHAYWAAAFFVISSIAGYHGFNMLKADPLEYNFDNLRNRASKTSGTAAYEKDIRRVFATSSSPAVVMLDTEEAAAELCPTVRNIAAGLPAEQNVIHTCTSLWDLVPKASPDPATKKQLMTEVRELLGNRLLKFGDNADSIAELRAKMSFTPPTKADIPEQLTRRFKEKDGRVGLITFVYPQNNKSINNGKNLLNYTSSLTDIHLAKSQLKVSAAGDFFILADLLRGIRSDGPFVAGIAFAGVFLIAIFLCGGLKNGTFMAICLIVSTWWMICVQGFFGIKYNFFNFIALPLTFGIGVDYPINVFIRSVQEKHRNYGRILASSGAAVFLCSLTTIISYATLLGATSQALASFAKLAIIGEFSCLFAALFLVPTALKLFGKFPDIDEAEEAARLSKVLSHDTHPSKTNSPN